jgi:hypothetical protein
MGGETENLASAASSGTTVGGGDESNQMFHVKHPRAMDGPGQPSPPKLADIVFRPVGYGRRASIELIVTRIS